MTGRPLRRLPGIGSSRAAVAWRRWTEPAEDGLPGWRVLVAFPALLAVLFAVLVTSGVTGSSSGIWHTFTTPGPDPDLLAGAPQPIRIDEWLVASSLTISQEQQGLPVDSTTFPGGTDQTLPSDQPTRDWSTAFRPQLLGFLFLPADQAAAWRWWLPALAMVAAISVLGVTLLPRRPVVAAILATGFVLSPFFQWWYMTVDFMPVAWAALVMAAAVWGIRSRRAPRIVLAAAAGLATTATAMGSYVPFMVPALLVAAAFVTGVVLTRGDGSTLPRRLLGIVPLAVAGLVAAVITGAFYLSHLDAAQRIAGTVYPGQRATPTGSAGGRNLLSLVAAPFTRHLGVTGDLDTNSSEASSFVLVGLALLLPLLWIAVRRARRGRPLDGAVVAMTALVVVLLAWLVIPGWDPLARLLLLDRTTPARVRPGLGLAALVAVLLWIAALDRARAEGDRLPRGPRALAAALGALTVVVPAIVLVARHESVVTTARSWIVIAAVCIVAIGLLAVHRVAAGAVALLLVGLALGAQVNPLYRGLYDFNDTAFGRAAHAMPGASSAHWVAVDSLVGTAALQQTGLHAYSGFQGYPSERMWSQIDPHHRSERVWNRLGNVWWTRGSGAPVPYNTQADLVTVPFDACAAFEQRHIRYVVTQGDLAGPCVVQRAAPKVGTTELRIYEVVAG